ncbi:MarR family transcriptional regulator [Deinococcus aluminii]
MTPSSSDVLSALDQCGGSATPGQLARVLGLSQPALGRLLDPLLDRGQLRRVQSSVRTTYERLRVEVDATLVRDTYRPLIHAHLQGQRSMPPSIAAALRLPVEEVRETCKAMLLAGELAATPVGAALVYGLPVLTRAPADDGLPHAPPTRVPVTPDLERQLHADLPPHLRRRKGETTRVAAKYGLTVGQVRAALRRLPVQR